MVNPQQFKTVSLNNVSVWIGTAEGKKRIGMIQNVNVTLNVNQVMHSEAGSGGLQVGRSLLGKSVTGSFQRIMVDKEVLEALWPAFDKDPVLFDLSGVGTTEDVADRNFTVSDCMIEGNVPVIDLSLDAATNQTINFTALNFVWA